MSLSRQAFYVVSTLHHCFLVSLFLADQIFYRSYVNRRHFRLRSFASLYLACFIVLYSRLHDFVVSPDGLWHHVAVTWENINGTYEIFVDGQLKGQGHGLQNGTLIRSNGHVLLGNDKDSSGFQVRDAYNGNISRVNFWDYVLPRKTIMLLSKHCGKENGDLVAWKDFRVGKFHGVINIREPSSCKRLK